MLRNNYYIIFIIQTFLDAILLLDIFIDFIKLVSGITGKYWVSFKRVQLYLVYINFLVTLFFDSPTE